MQEGLHEVHKHQDTKGAPDEDEETDEALNKKVVR